MTNEQLVALIQAGEDTAANMARLWEQNRRFVFKMADKYKGQAEEEDLVQEGYLGLCRAVDGYDPEQGAGFLSYAGYWIRHSMARYIHNNGTVRIPVHEQGRLYQYRKLCSGFLLEEGREPTNREIGHYLGLDAGGVRQLKKAAKMAVVKSLDAPAPGDDEGVALSDTVAAPGDVESAMLDKVQAEQLKAVIWPLVDALPGQQSAVLRARFIEGKEFKDIGAETGHSFQNAYQAYQGGLRNLRQPGRARKLLPFLKDYIDTHAYWGNGVAAFNRTGTSSTEWTAIKLAEMELASGAETVLKNHAQEKISGKTRKKAPEINGK